MLSKLNWLNVAQLVAVFAIASIPLVAPAISHAQLINQFNCPQGTGIRCTETSLQDLFRTFINYALGIAFFVAVGYLIYGGFQYLTSGGNEGQAKLGTANIRNALIGVIIIVLSYTIVTVVYRFAVGNNIGP